MGRGGLLKCLSCGCIFPTHVLFMSTSSLIKKKKKIRDTMQIRGWGKKKKVVWLVSLMDFEEQTGLKRIKEIEKFGDFFFFPFFFPPIIYIFSSLPSLIVFILCNDI